MLKTEDLGKSSKLSKKVSAGVESTINTLGKVAVAYCQLSSLVEFIHLQWNSSDGTEYTNGNNHNVRD